MPTADPGPAVELGPTGYDEPGSRTRLAWLRTWLAALGVSALLLRGFIVSDAGWVPIVALLVCLVVLAVVAVARSRRIRRRLSPPAPTLLLVAAVILVLAIAGLGTAQILWRGI